MECLKLITVRHGDEAHRVPCGKCAFCLTNKRSQWMFRIGQEMKTQEVPGYFLTMTYDEKYVRRVANGRLSLRFTDVQKFLKRVRKKKYYVKYIVVGEYGAKTQRPHYHALIWTDCPAVELEKFWFMGRIHFGSLSMASAMYCLKYIIQPKEADERSNGGVEKTRAQFSKGLGLSFLTNRMYNYLTSDYDNPVMAVTVDGNKVALPRYYKNKIYTKYQLRRAGSKHKWESIKKKRKKIRQLRDQGITKKGDGQFTYRYMQSLRCIEAKRIIAKTKYNLTI